MFRFPFPSPRGLHYIIELTEQKQNQIKNKWHRNPRFGHTISGSVSCCEPHLLRGRHSRQRVHTCRSPPTYSYDQVSSAISEWFSSPRFRNKGIIKGEKRMISPKQHLRNSSFCT
ncbi:hypothetical protein I7I53_00230 [Histoplasma capsulatum var. duboisii H88]|uniref:Uncharacterized protein n=1 Tax=Ajellomyces capsulatus (strain H88) TaxID=544711 RepID=A0A8A1LGR9_AJEC8|nr:hypothetical protein I7I53_00230 [Histoplasma capsulatum var. duboisii H88]